MAPYVSKVQVLSDVLKHDTWALLLTNSLNIQSRGFQNNLKKSNTESVLGKHFFLACFGYIFDILVVIGRDRL